MTVSFPGSCYWNEFDLIIFLPVEREASLMVIPSVGRLWRVAAGNGSTWKQSLRDTNVSGGLPPASTMLPPNPPYPSSYSPHTPSPELLFCTPPCPPPLHPSACIPACSNTSENPSRPFSSQLILDMLIFFWTIP